MTSKNEKFINDCKAFMREVGLVTDNNINYYSPLLGKDEWFVMIWDFNNIRVVNDVYIADNAEQVCTTNAIQVKSLKAFKNKLTSAIEKSKKLTVHLRKRTINKDFVNEDE
jgi:hypothetical protein